MHFGSLPKGLSPTQNCQSTTFHYNQSMIALALQSPDPSVTLRPVLAADAPALHQTCLPERSLSVVQQLITRAQQNAEQGCGLGVVVLATPGGAVCGFGQMRLWPNCAEISDLVVAEGQRRRGLGTALVQYMVRAAREMHAPCIEIGAAVANAGAVALYRRLGFKDSHTLMLNLGSGHEPVLFLRLSLPSL